jgi:peptidoglycan hydrolase-like protein with peptidoglycan-binding domain
MESPAVLQLQKVLAAEGYLSATPNGVFGPATLAALRAWQTANGLPSTGYFGPMSRAKMNAR